MRGHAEFQRIQLAVLRAVHAVVEPQHVQLVLVDQFEIPLHPVREEFLQRRSLASAK